MKPEPLPEAKETQDSQDPVWKLLARRSQPQVPQDFVDQVLAEVRLTEQLPSAPTSSAKIVAFPTTVRSGSSGRLWGSLAAAAAVAVGLYLHFQNKPSGAPDMVAQPPTWVVPAQTTVGNDDSSLEQELTAVQDMHALIAVEDPTQLNDAQLFAFLN